MCLYVRLDFHLYWSFFSAVDCHC